eukprot:scaffold204955_cov21-Tisochrysis_lutea.AAC.1
MQRDARAYGSCWHGGNYAVVFGQGLHPITNGRAVFCQQCKCLIEHYLCVPSYDCENVADIVLVVFNLQPAEQRAGALNNE